MDVSETNVAHECIEWYRDATVLRRVKTVALYAKEGHHAEKHLPTQPSRRHRYPPGKANRRDKSRITRSCSFFFVAWYTALIRRISEETLGSYILFLTLLSMRIAVDVNKVSVTSRLHPSSSSYVYQCIFILYIVACTRLISIYTGWVGFMALSSSIVLSHQR